MLALKKYPYISYPIGIVSSFFISGYLLRKYQDLTIDDHSGQVRIGMIRSINYLLSGEGYPMGFFWPITIYRLYTNSPLRSDPNDQVIMQILPFEERDLNLDQINK